MFFSFFFFLFFFSFFFFQVKVTTLHPSYIAQQETKVNARTQRMQKSRVGLELVTTKTTPWQNHELAVLAAALLKNITLKS